MNVIEQKLALLKELNRNTDTITQQSDEALAELIGPEAMEHVLASASAHKKAQDANAKAIKDLTADIKRMADEMEISHAKAGGYEVVEVNRTNFDTDLLKGYSLSWPAEARQAIIRTTTSYTVRKAK